MRIHFADTLLGGIIASPVTNRPRSIWIGTVGLALPFAIGFGSMFLQGQFGLAVEEMVMYITLETSYDMFLQGQLGLAVEEMVKSINYINGFCTLFVRLSSGRLLLNVLYKA